MSRPLRVLLVEDVEDDALLLMAHLRAGGCEPRWERVETAEEMAAALEHGEWDVVLADHKLPRFSGPEALALLREKGRDVPFILVSGVVGEDAAVAVMRAGAHDFIPKDHLTRLVPAIEREMADAEDRRRQREAEAERAHLAAIVRFSDEAMLAMTPEGIITAWNPGADLLYGYTAAEMVGRAVFLLSPEDDAEGAEDVQHMLSEVRRGRSVPAHDTMRRRKDGSLVPVEASAAPVLDAEGHVAGVSWVGRNITERKQAEKERERLLEAEREARAEAQAANESKDQFVALVAHELRNPLNAIMAGVGVLRASHLGDGRVGRALEIVARNAHLQARLVNDLLDLSRLRRGKLRFQRVPVELEKVVAAACHAFETEARSARLTLTGNCESGLWVHGDFDRLQQAVLNFLSNAVKFTPAGGAVSIVCQAHNNGHARVARVMVEDTGIGLDQAMLDHVFTLFYQGEATGASKPGLGLGLALVKEIVEAHGGRVWAESEGPGKGSRFIAELPLIEAPAVSPGCKGRSRSVGRGGAEPPVAQHPPEQLPDGLCRPGATVWALPVPG